jgi:hypothetical protein
LYEEPLSTSLQERQGYKRGRLVDPY